MKKTLLALAIAVASVGAFAQAAPVAPASTGQGITAFTKYDYDRANGKQGAWKSQHEIAVGAAFDTKYGTFDAAAIGRQLVTNTRDNNLGFELGYSNGLKLGIVDVTGRVSYGQINRVDQRAAGFGGNSSFYSLAVEGSVPVPNADGTSVFVGYRMRNGLNSDTPSISNRFTVGLDMKLAPNLSLRAGYAFTKQAGYNMNGITTALNYSF